MNSTNESIDARAVERALLIVALAFVVVAALALSIAPAARLATWTAWTAWRVPNPAFVAAVWLLCAIWGYVLLERRAPHRDPLLYPVAMLLSGWGVVLISRLAPGFGLRQSVWLLVASAALSAVLLAPPNLRWLRRYPYLWLVAGLLLTALTLLFGVNPSGVGPRLWLGCCGAGAGGVGFYVQPSEVLKVLLIVYLAGFLAEKRGLLLSGRRLGRIEIPTAFIAPLLTMWGFSLLLLISQRDLGTGSLLFGIFLVMLYLAIGRIEYLLAGAALLLLGGIVAYRLFDVVQVRVDGWWNPWQGASGDSFQIVQALIALANGGLIGTGFGIGAPRVVPVIHSDFIFTAVVEEWGLVGGLLLALLLLILVVRGLRIAAAQRAGFNTLLAGGVAALIGLQTLLITGGVIKLLPLTGVTLPFVSYGGSALVMNFALLGILIRLSDTANRTRRADS